MLSPLSSSAPLVALTALALATTGCAGKLHGSAHFSAHVPTVALNVPSPTVTIQGQAGAQGNAHAQAQAQGQYAGQYGGSNAGQYGGSNAGQYGGQYGGTNGGGYGSYNGSPGGACGPSAPPAPPPPPAQPWRPKPVFYGLPLEAAQDVIFVLDRSSSMSETDASTSALVNPGVALSSLGNAAYRAQLLAATAPQLTPSALAGLPSLLTPSANGIFTPINKLDVAKSELTAAIAGLPDGTRYDVIFFGDTVAAFSPTLLTLNPISRISSMVFVQTISSEGSTAAVPALRAAYASHPRRVVFLSDGLANVGGDGNQLLAEARVQMRNGVRFDTVGVGNDQDRALMATLAAESGGLSTSR